MSINTTPLVNYETDRFGPVVNEVNKIWLNALTSSKRQVLSKMHALHFEKVTSDNRIITDWVGGKVLNIGFDVFNSQEQIVGWLELLVNESVANCIYTACKPDNPYIVRRFTRPILESFETEEDLVAVAKEFAVECHSNDDNDPKWITCEKKIERRSMNQFFKDAF